MSTPLHISFQGERVRTDLANVWPNLVVKALHVLLQASQSLEHLVAQCAFMFSFRRMGGRMLAQVLCAPESFVAHNARVWLGDRVNRAQVVLVFQKMCELRSAYVACVVGRLWATHLFCIGWSIGCGRA